MSNQDGIWVTSGAHVVMKGTRKNNLNYFQGSIVNGIVATVSDEDVDSETTMLWHIRLGHIGEGTL